MKSDELNSLFTNIADSIRAKEDSTELIDATDFPQRIASISTGSDFPSGGIIVWSGSADNIPDGWALCDGTNETPDLRGRFVLGNSESHAVGTKGGEETHTLTVEELASHTHQYNLPSTGVSGLASGNNTYHTFSYISKPSTVSAGSSRPHNNMPPYYTLCYIMKL